ncbi:uncharacterized protein ISCGN_002903 [Ixodes scapularis]
MAETSSKYLTLNTHKGLFAVNRLPFGVSSAPAIFQRIMDTMLEDLKGVSCYLDDVLITGRTPEEHLANLEAVLKRLSERGVRVKKEKCAFFQKELRYLGHVISAAGVSTTPEKIEALLKVAAPSSKQQLQSFLGMVNYYGKFVPRLSTLASPLYRLLRQDQRWCWDKACQAAFEEIKTALATPSILAHYDPSKPLQVACDASQYGIGAVLSHVTEDGSTRPVAYASRTLTEAEKKYSQLEKEALAIIFGIKKFHLYIYGRVFTLVTDHKPLQTILGPKTGIPSIAAARLQRWAVTLSAYKYSLVYKRSSDNAEADFCSRFPLESGKDDSCEGEESFYALRLESMPVSSQEIARATSRDPLLCQVLEYTSMGWPTHVQEQQLRPFFDRRLQMSVHQGCLMYGMRVVVPSQLQEPVLDELHQGHPGIVRSKELARSYVWWPSIDSDLERKVRSCQACQEQRNDPCKAPLHPWAWPTAPWRRLHLDFAGPFRGTMFLVVVDAHSKWPEVFTMQSTTTERTVRCLRELFCRFGIPETIVSDNGPQLVSEEFKVFMRNNGVRHVVSAPYHPSTNGLAERFVQTLKSALRKSSAGESLEEALQHFLLTYRNTPHSTTGETPANLLMGRRLRSRLDVIKPTVEGKVIHKQFIQSKQRRTSREEICPGDNVLVRNYRSSPRWLRGTVLKKNGPVSYQVQVTTPRGKFIWRRHLDQLLSQTRPTATPVPSDTDDAEGFLVFSPGEPSVPATVQEHGPQQPHTIPQRDPVPPTGRSTSEGRYPSRERRPPDRYQARS